MLKLRKVEIVGFKSFCERTVVTFSGTGTTCIVGPNGCGKSNVVDAISWVLGEQSHKSLRAERMADCIFNGTTKRPPMGLAEVTITMEDPELAEAARFVLESSAAADQSESATDASVDPASESQSLEAMIEGAIEATETFPENPAAADAAATETQTETGFKLKRKKKAEKPALVSKPGEVVVSRRLYRCGQSEYLINGRVGRLRDIQEMFMGIGLGPDSYAIIEQGRIGQILATKPMERRAIIEEAAGVTKFKTKKRLSEAKLESSKLNLSRVNDIVVEVEKQLGSLKRQASKARRYAEIREQMRGIVRQMLAGKARELDVEADRVQTHLAELTAIETQHAQMIHEQEAEQDRLSQRIYTLDAEIRQNQNVLNHTTLEVDRSENRINFNRTRSAELTGRNEQITLERNALSAKHAEWQTRNDAQQLAVETARRDSVTVQTRVEELTAAPQRALPRSPMPKHAWRCCAARLRKLATACCACTANRSRRKKRSSTRLTRCASRKRAKPACWKAPFRCATMPNAPRSTGRTLSRSRRTPEACHRTPVPHHRIETIARGCAKRSRCPARHPRRRSRPAFHALADSERPLLHC